MNYIRRDLGQRLQYEAALLHGGMRDGQALLVNDRVIKQENVDVDDARTFFLRSAATQLLLDVENAGEQLFGALISIQGDGTIQKPGLCGEFHGFGFVER